MTEARTLWEIFDSEGEAGSMFATCPKCGKLMLSDRNGRFAPCVCEEDTVKG